MLTDELHWHSIYDNRIEDLIYPLPRIDFPQAVFNHILRVTVTADSIPENWERVGWFYHRLTEDNTIPFIAEKFEININIQNLIQLQNLTDVFYISFKPMFRFLWINLKVEYYDLS